MSSDEDSDEEENEDIKLMKERKWTGKDLLYAAQNGSFQEIIDLLHGQKIQPDINYKGPDKKTPLYAAASEGHS